MATLNSQPKDFKVKICICGKSSETKKVDISQYRNNIMYQTIGLVIVTFFGAIYLAATLQGEDDTAGGVFKIIISLLLFSIWLAYKIWRTQIFIKEGHSLVCAARRAYIGVI